MCGEMRVSTSPAPWVDEGTPANPKSARRRLAATLRIAGYGPVYFGILFLAANLLVRTALLWKTGLEADCSISKIFGLFAVGTFYDGITAAYFALPLSIYLCVAPSKWFARKWHRTAFSIVYFLLIFFLLLIAVAEFLFWDEFGARFNFIAVDYLIYTNEVLGNIRESYPMPLIIGGLTAAALLLTIAIRHSRTACEWMEHRALGSATRAQRIAGLSPFLFAPILATVFINGRQVPDFGNAYNQELARNGLYSFFAEYRNNELNYDQFYEKVDEHAAFTRMNQLLEAPATIPLLDNSNPISRHIACAGPEKRWNVIQITVESLSAEFLGVYGDTNGLTPHLDAIARQSLWFSNFYATGTRTVRGMEALTLSLPPTPGQSIVRRPHNENLFSLGSVFRKKGYDTAFIYGGYGMFDNMNTFFGGNGYRIIDRTKVSSSDISFANAWGACDADALGWSIREADAAHARHQPFFHFVMTTSNHRPFTYPEGKIDIPSHSGREGGVKYTDYAIGDFIEQVRQKPWFKNTLIVIVADHCAASAGRTDLPVKRFEIPLFFYNPDLVGARKVGTLSSQIDYAPTLLSLMNWSYDSRFYGKDILSMKPEEGRAFIASYQKLGLMNQDTLAVLKPVRKHSLYHYDRSTGAEIPLETATASENQILNDCIANYQTASSLFRHGQQRAFH